jgi:hypothetical protein
MKNGFQRVWKKAVQFKLLSHRLATGLRSKNLNQDNWCPSQDLSRPPHEPTFLVKGAKEKKEMGEE